MSLVQTRKTGACLQQDHIGKDHHRHDEYFSFEILPHEKTRQMAEFTFLRKLYTTVNTGCITYYLVITVCSVDYIQDLTRFLMWF